MRAMKNAAQYNGGSLAAWLVTIAQNLCFNHLHALNRGPRSLDDLQNPPSNSGTTVSLDVAIDLAQRIERLPASQRLCIRLFYFNGLTFKEIARASGFTFKEVKSHLQNGIGRMRRSEIRP